MYSETHYQPRKESYDDFDLHVDELESFIGVQIARGVLVGKNTPVKQLWSNKWGQLIFRNTMSRDRYQEIMKHLRFDDFLVGGKGEKLTIFD